MSRRDEVQRQLHAQRVVPVLRSQTLSEALDTARVLAGEGLTAVELTTSIPHVLEGVEALAIEGLVVGLGTVRDADAVAAAARAGASFVVSYFHPARFVRTAQEHDVLAVPGALSVQELQAVAEAGAELVKVFPAWQSAPRIVKDLAPLLPSLGLMPTGGLNATSAADWLTAGAAAVGMGSELGTVARHGADGMRERVRTLVAALPQGAPACQGRQ
jgi:2-dehydro-3-deoxyphosphogluconate aldolase/(4S)-4-hydroxy-2-oxoglutarate aldolase